MTDIWEHYKEVSEENIAKLNGGSNSYISWDGHCQARRLLPSETRSWNGMPIANQCEIRVVLL